MNWKQRLSDFLALPERVVVQQRTVEVVEERFVRDGSVREAIASNRREDVGWSSGVGTRDMTPYMHDLHLERARNEATTHPVAKRCLEIHRTMVVADGIELVATSENEEYRTATQKILDDFRDANELEELFPEFVDEVAVSGELNVPVFVRCGDPGHAGDPDKGIPARPARVGDGLVRMGLILAENVDRVVKNPYNALDLQTLVMKRWVTQDAAAGGDVERIHWPIMRKGYGNRWVGDEGPDYKQCPGVFVLQVNGRTGSSRGLSDLLPVLDWLVRFNQTFTGEIDRHRHMRAFIWSVLLEGADDKAIADWCKKNSKPPTPNTVMPHNEKEVWSAVAPELNTAEGLELIREIFKIILGALGIPIHYFVEAESVNRASAEEMTDPVTAKDNERQTLLQGFIRKIVEFQLQVAREYREILKNVPPEEQTFNVVIRKPDTRKLGEGGATMDKWVSAYAKAETAGYMTADEAGRGVRDKFRAYGDEFEEKDREGMEAADAQKEGGLAVTPDGGNTSNGAQEPKRSSLDRVARQVLDGYQKEWGQKASSAA